MTAQERCNHEIEAPWLMQEHGSPIISGTDILCKRANATLIAAAPDLVDEVIRLRKWQQETLPWLNVAAAQFKPRPLDLVTFNSTVGTIDRLIAEAQEDYVDGHK